MDAHRPRADQQSECGKRVRGGCVEAAATDPTNADVMFIGASNGGVRKTGNWTTDGSPTWLPLTDDKPSLDFAGYHPLVVHASKGPSVFAAVSKTGAGISKSTNGGLSWQLLGNSLLKGRCLGRSLFIPRTLTLFTCRSGEGVRVVACTSQLTVASIGRTPPHSSNKAT